MTTFEKTELQLRHDYDPGRCRHFIDGTVSVLHCHHYATLYCQLADDVSMLDGKRLLAECAEDIFLDVLRTYFERRSIDALAERIAIAEQYYATSGMGSLKVVFAGPESGEVELFHSHVDEGWVKKWGTRSAPVNFITWGYVAALFSAVFGQPARRFRVTETASIVSGAERSKLVVVVA